MTATALKRAVWLLALLTLTAGAWLGLSLVGSLFARSQRAQVQNSALNSLQGRHAQPGQLVWLPDDSGLPRPMEGFTRDAVTSDYRLGSQELGYALYSGDASGLGSYFQEAALQDAQLATHTSLHGEYSDWDHRLTLHFYAPDGATVAFTDEYWYAQGEADEADGHKLVATRLARRTVDVVMALDDGNWRVHHWRVLADDLPAPAARPLHPGLAARLAQVRGVNYQARSAPFAALWGSLPARGAAPTPQDAERPRQLAREIDDDFGRVQALGLNTVRVFVPYPLPPRALQTLNTLLDSAGHHRLQVIPTLLDGYAGYRLADLPGAVQMLLTLAPALSRPQVLAVDLKNEADLDAPRTDLTHIRFFLKVLAGQARTLTGKPLTVGLTAPDPQLARSLELVTVHSYAGPQGVAQALAKARTLRLPVLLEEFGFHTQANKLPDPHTEHEQAWELAGVRAAAAGQGVGWLVWTLYDLPGGKVPGGRQVERHLGILRADGSAKPAALALQGQAVSPPSLAERVGKWRFLPPYLLLPGAAGAVWWLRRRRIQKRPSDSG